jgi:hypothetical protein
MAASSALALVLLAEPVWADRLVIRKPGVHPEYNLEAEPHLALGFIDPPGPAHGTGVGLGFRGAIEIVDNGFVPTINNTVAIGFGIDWLRYGGGRCPADPTEPCEEGHTNLWIPLVLQWNFWLSEDWSVFGEPGPALRLDDSNVSVEPLGFWAGGRWHFAQYAALTMRVGYPTFTVGVSLLL